MTKLVKDEKEFAKAQEEGEDLNNVEVKEPKDSLGRKLKYFVEFDYLYLHIVEETQRIFVSETFELSLAEYLSVTKQIKDKADKIVFTPIKAVKDQGVVCINNAQPLSKIMTWQEAQSLVIHHPDQDHKVRLN